MKNQLIFIGVFISLMACEKDEGYEGFAPIFKDSIYNSLQVQENFDYYEIRNNYCFDTTRYVIVYSEGIKPYTDSIFTIANEGVFYSNSDVCMYNNIFIQNGSGYSFLTSYSEIINFLGPIDSQGDALFVAHLNGYFFIFNDKEFGIKEDSEGFLIYACKLTSICAPIQTDKFLIKIDVHGNIKIIEQSVLIRYDNACI